MLSIQLLALSLIPILSGAVPGMMSSPLTLMGVEERVSEDYLVGTWKYSDEFFRWGVTDKERSRIRPFKGQAFMMLHKDGTMKMVNLFKPSEGRWELCSEGIMIFDPVLKEKSTQILPIRKRDKDKIWVLLPFTGGSAGIGMVRITENQSADKQ